MELAAAIGGFVSLGLQLSESIITYYDGWRNCRQDVDDVCNSVGEMRQMLATLAEAVRRRTLNGFDETAVFKHALQRCETTMRRLDRKVAKVKDNTATGGFRARTRFEWERVKYPLKESTILKLRDLLHEQKLDLVLILNGLNLDASSAELDTITQNMSRLSCDISQIKAYVGQNNEMLETSRQAITELEHKKVLEWIYSEDPVGRGKTILCSAIIEHLQSFCTANTDNVLLFFFFSFADAHRPNHLLCLSSLLRQMCADDRIFRDVMNLYKKFNEPATRSNLQYQDIELALDSAFASLERCKKIHIIFDALDELPNDADEFQRSRVLDWVIKTSTRFRHVRILIASRSNSISQAIEGCAGSIPSMEIATIDSMSNREDMFLYLEAQLEKNCVLGKIPGDFLSQLSNDMIRLSDGMFQWLHLQIVELTKLPNPRIKDIHRVLKSMPTSLDDTYVRMLQGIHYVFSKEAANALMWLSISFETTPPAEEDRLQGEGILPCLSELVRRTEIDRNCLVLSHFSVKEFLTSEALKNSPHSSYGFDENSAHASIAESCIAYINYCYCSNHKRCTWTDLEQFPSLEYACRYWFKHLTSAGKKDETKLAPLASTLLHSGEEWEYTLLIYNHLDPNPPFEYSRRRRHLRSPLGWACVLGLESVVKLLLSEKSDLNLIQDIEFTLEICPPHADELPSLRAFLPSSGTALTIAVEFGHTSIVELLLDKGADIDAEGCGGDTALSVACKDRNEDLVRYLLRRGATPHCHCLAAAVLVEAESICEILLAAGASVNEEGKKDTPLMVAAMHDNCEMCQFLLDFGADINYQTNLSEYEIRLNGPNDALATAVYYENVQTVKFLLSNGAHIRGSALLFSLTGQDDGPTAKLREICHILIQHGAEMNPDFEGNFKPPLAMALSNGWLDIARFMISKGALGDPGNSSYLLGGNILLEAVSSVDMTRELLSLGVDVNCPIVAVDSWSLEDVFDACNFTTALQAAAYHGHVDTVKLLLENGADPNIRGGRFGNTLLSLFAGAYHAMVTKIIDLQRQARRHALIKDNTLQIYELLQERGVDNIAPWNLLDGLAICECALGIKYSKIEADIVIPRPIEEKFSAIPSDQIYLIVRADTGEE
ncbi:ankyrin repeat-containing domain protein [Penicillium chermesinum]|uniref:Ankyrin repeat-containing domain protein n=1 Tax=Penicillium chermesinum TaxID=63820 RepID=A0A9W9PLI1_9EURO|nr:ankyrin repeat-containing domain protein [Penicillium chermesinum]KAJ5247888.1 ankyrin repeat-containing domain protein [Penicillium chermesinum]